MANRAHTPRVYDVVKDIIENDDFSSNNFRRDTIPDRDEHGNVVTLNNGEHFDVRKKSKRTRLVTIPDESMQETTLADTDTISDTVTENTNVLPDYIPNPPGRVMRVAKRHETYNWSEIRKHFVLGKRTQLEDGSWVSEDYTLKELAQRYGVRYDYLRYKSSTEGWGKIRKAYLARVNQINIGQELGLYTQENYQAEIAAMNACNKLGTVLDKYIEHKFGDILDTNEDTNTDGSDISEELTEQMNAVNKNTGTPIFITELKEAVKVANDIYALQRKVYENAPRTEIEIIEKITNKPKFRNEKERQAKIQQLQAKLSGVLKPNELVETVSNDSIIEDEY